MGKRVATFDSTQLGTTFLRRRVGGGTPSRLCNGKIPDGKQVPLSVEPPVLIKRISIERLKINENKTYCS